MGKDEGYFLSDISANYVQRGELPSYILVVDWFQQSLQALATMHASGRIHGAVGLETIFVDGDHKVEITDRRPSSLLSGPPSQITGPSWDRESAVASGHAPTELVGDPRVDLYGVGAAFYQLLTNQPLGTTSALPSSVNNTVPKGFDTVLMRLVAAHPSDCYPSAMDALVDLAVLRRSPQTAPIPVLVRSVAGTRGEGVPRAAMIAAGAVVGVVGGAVVGFFMHTFVPATCVVGALVGGVVGVFANPNV